MHYTNFNSLGIKSLDVTNEVGGNVKTTSNAGVVMWSENGRTFIASYYAYTKVKPFYGTWGLEGDPIPYCFDDSVRKALGV